MLKCTSRWLVLLLWLAMVPSLCADAIDPTHCDSHDATDRDAVDGAQQTEALTLCTDDDTTTMAIKQGKDPDDIMRVEFPGLSDIAVGDTISVHFGMLMNYDVMALLPYDGATSVLNTNRLTYTLSGGSPAVFTLTSNFIGDLCSTCGETWAARIAEDTVAIDGDILVTEVDSNLTTGAAPPSQVIMIGGD